jgi:hypothetical protein
VRYLTIKTILKRKQHPKTASSFIASKLKA